MSDMIGASIEVNGGKVYDPLGVLKLHDVAPTAFPHAKWMRESELKHCRAAMLATVGLWTGQFGIYIVIIFIIYIYIYILTIYINQIK